VAQETTAHTTTMTASAEIQRYCRASGLPSSAKPIARAIPMPAIDHRSRPRIVRRTGRSEGHHARNAPSPAIVPPNVERRLIQSELVAGLRPSKSRTTSGAKTR
jgi:hypothetical protein